MKHYLNTKKLVKSIVVPAVLSFGLITGGSVTAASGFEKGQTDSAGTLKTVSVKMNQSDKKAEAADRDVSAQSKAEEKAQSHTKEKEDAQQKEENKGQSQAESKAADPVKPAQPDTPSKADANTSAEFKQKAEDRKLEAQSNAKDGNKPEQAAQPSGSDAEEKAQNQGKGEKAVISQASTHASETALENANENAAIFSHTEVLEEYLFGSDSATSANPEGTDFYIGKLGYGSLDQFEESTGSGIYFSSDRAEEASYVYGYWFLSGMQIAPDGVSPTEWGEEQAKLALETYEEMKRVYGSKVRPVIFIDVEPALTGMGEYDYINNQLIYSAFINYLNEYGEGVTPGTYSSTWSWDVTMGSYSPDTPGAYWLAYYTGDLPSESELTTSNPYWITFPGTDEQAQIWQYYGGYDDYNVATMLP
ncbi:hypothetical protein [Bacillus sp. Marseille-Q1617]|uniref:hypothetical protein n=1 Tax=Bacillus sp. Marseille-Q1617 TaxID=2736887 RepID=UPI00158BD921|nr:hypothetical protein [Bacillus sp. Marseille-Q1617]